MRLGTGVAPLPATVASLQHVSDHIRMRMIETIAQSRGNTATHCFVPTMHIPIAGGTILQRKAALSPRSACRWRLAKGPRGGCSRTACEDTTGLRSRTAHDPDPDPACRYLDRCAKEDLYYPHPLVQDVLWWTLSHAEPLLRGSWLRKRALEEAMRLVHHEVRPPHA